MIKDKEFIEKHVIVPILTPYTPYGIDSTGSTFVASFPECFAFRSLGTQVSFLQEASIFISHNASRARSSTSTRFRYDSHGSCWLLILSLRVETFSDYDKGEDNRPMYPRLYSPYVNLSPLSLRRQKEDALLRPRGNGSQQSTIHITRETYREGKMTACSPAKICGGGSCRLERGMSGRLGEAGISYLQLATLRLSGWFSSRFSDRWEPIFPRGRNKVDGEKLRRESSLCPVSRRAAAGVVVASHEGAWDGVGFLLTKENQKAGGIKIDKRNRFSKRESPSGGPNSGVFISPCNIHGLIPQISGPVPKPSLRLE
ncbi:hypothetical protein V1477_000970 [Vespula maculifrons]|uniref:Uncharacterized protein n=1 Tax=Vespula maculifrons TaxID=7453 RepID=A0ABD2D0E6_VESMC